jgi:hypothetical protein
VSRDEEVREVCRNADAYEALKDAAAMALPEQDVAIGLYTTGWAAPLTPEGCEEMPPSENPQRTRAQVTVLMTTLFNHVSVVRLADREEEIVSEEGAGHLANALTVTLVMMLRRRFACDDPE